jgi:hypothetical protein
MRVLGRYLWRSLLSMAMVIVGLVVVPIALWRGGVDRRLPAWARPWNNDVEPYGDTARRPAIEAATGWKKGWLRFRWLALRNPANNFADTMGVYHTPDTVVTAWGNPNTSDQGESGCHFLLMKSRSTGEVHAFEFYWVWAYSDTRCLRVRLGWKLWDNPAPLVHVINPVMTFTGKRA